MIEEILTDLLAKAPHIALSTSEDFDTYWDQVGFWLNQIDNEFVCSRWQLRFVIAIHKSWGVPMPRVAQCLQWAISDARERDADA